MHNTIALVGVLAKVLARTYNTANTEVPAFRTPSISTCISIMLILAAESPFERHVQVRPKSMDALTP
eukprot:1799714-Prymnesium_polylepis.1